jgi:SAM-dependent methyltransferase
MDYVAESFWQERYRKFDLTTSGHLDLPEAYNRWLYRMKSKKILAAAERHGLDLREARVLEFGCGTGVYVEMWKNLGVPELTGFDIAQVSADTLQSRFPGYRFQQADLGDPGLVRSYMARRMNASTSASAPSVKRHDFITAFNVLYHIVEDAPFRQALKNANALAEPGALFLITDLFVHGPEELHGYMKYRTLGSYIEALSAAGFEVLDRKPVYVTMVKAVDAGRGLKKRAFDGYWSRVTPWIDRSPDGMGRLLYAADSILTRLFREGPSLELLACRKIRECAGG